MEMQVYVANLGKYNEGELVGAWFTPPIDYEEMEERIGLNGEYEEYAVHDYELPFQIPEYISIDELNRLCEMVMEIDCSPICDELENIQGMWFGSLEELLENVDDIHCYSDCDSMEEIVYDYIEDGFFGEVPEHLKIYLDYSAIGRDLEIAGNFLVTAHGVFEYAG